MTARRGNGETHRVTTPHQTLFDRDLALTDTDRPYVYEGSFDPRWYIDRSLHGGHVISVIVRAFDVA